MYRTATLDTGTAPQDREKLSPKSGPFRTNRRRRPNRSQKDGQDGYRKTLIRRDFPSTPSEIVGMLQEGNGLPRTTLKRKLELMGQIRRRAATAVYAVQRHETWR